MSAAETLLAELAGKAGVTLDAAAVAELAERLVTYGAELIAARAWRDAAVKGAARANAIDTPAAAEEYQRR